MRTKLAILAASITAAVALVTLVVASRDIARPRKSAAPSNAASNSELAELKAEMSRLQRQVSRNERAAHDLTARLESSATAVASGAPVAATPDELAEAARPPRPSHEQQIMRFEKHFANLDALRGEQRDAALETKFRELLTNEQALKLTSLSKLKIEEISCGNGFCKVDVDFTDPGVARMGQTEMQVQLAPILSGATIYSVPGSTKLHAYFATGGESLPPFPTVEEVAL